MQDIEPINAYIRQIQEGLHKEKKPYSKKGLISWSIRLKALKYLEDGEVSGNPKCKTCNGRGYILLRDKKDAKGNWTWLKDACHCITKNIKPTTLYDNAELDKRIADAERPKAEPVSEGVEAPGPKPRPRRKKGSGEGTEKV